MSTRSSRIRYFVLIFVVLGIGVVASTEFVEWSSSNPCIHYPHEVHLGEYELNQKATAKIEISNNGNQDLVISSINTNCSCTGLELEDHGKFYRIESLTIAPVSKREVVIRVKVGGVIVGSKMVSIVKFVTNDPKTPIGSIAITVNRVHGGITMSPEKAVIGTVQQNDSLTQQIEIVDSSVVPRRISRIVSNDPSRVTFSYRPCTPFKPVTTGGPGSVIGTIDLMVATDKPGDVNASLLIYVEGRETHPPDVLPIVGRVLPIIEVNPSSIVLPRSSSNGPLYESSFVIRNNAKSHFELEEAILPKGVTMTVIHADDQFIRAMIKLNPAEYDKKTSEQKIQLSTLSDKIKTVIEVPIYFNALLQRD